MATTPENLSLDSILESTLLTGVSIYTGTVNVRVHINDQYLEIRNDEDQEVVVVDIDEASSFLRLCGLLLKGVK